MENNFKYLTKIHGVFNEINTHETLAVFSDPLKGTLKICYKSAIISSKKSEVSEGEILLKDIKRMEFKLISNNINEKIIKELIFYKYADEVGHTLLANEIY